MDRIQVSVFDIKILSHTVTGKGCGRGTWQLLARTDSKKTGSCCTSASSGPENPWAEGVEEEEAGDALSGFCSSTRSDRFGTSSVYGPSPRGDRPTSAGCRWPAPLAAGEFRIGPDARVDGLLSQRWTWRRVCLFQRTFPRSGLNTFKLEKVVLLLVLTIPRFFSLSLFFSFLALPSSLLFLKKSCTLFKLGIWTMNDYEPVTQLKK